MFIHQDGHFYPVRCNARAIVKNGVKRGTVIEIQDVTDLHRAEEQRLNFTLELKRQVNERTLELVNSQTRLRELATELTLTEQRERHRVATELHDYLSQLLVVSRLKLGHTRQVLGADSPSLALVKETEDVLDQALTYTRTLVAELSPPVLSEFGLRAALEWLVRQMPQHGLTVEMEGEDIQDIDVPEDQAILLFQSVRELFLNVTKHADTTRATLALYKDKDIFQITVRDRGKGFHSAEGRVLHEPSDPVTFGLFSIRERMVAMGGSFEIQSSPGNGTSTSLSVPLQSKVQESTNGLIQDEVLKVDQNKERETHFPSGGRSTIRETQHIRIVLVDDHVMVREGLRKMLEGHEDLELVGEAGNGEEAIDLVERLKPSLVIMDVNMPKMNGIEATSLIKRHHPEIIVIGLSVNTGQETQRAMLKAGAIALLPKEAAVAELYQFIKKTYTFH
jgi:signal transduction histidine kinase/CheY-like chemotaxis protein